ncbi:MAG: hypothetical protein RLZZ546_498 [Bacteroidota bacterium]|jgi:beta-glucanase (GH16 family)
MFSFISNYLYLNKKIISFLGLFFLMSCSKKVSLLNSYSLVWSDEFIENGMVDSNKWGYDVGDGCPDNCGWGNNEAQYYTLADMNNCRVSNGLLIIEAHKKDQGNKHYTSTKLISKNKGDWKYGKIEVKAKLPKGKGVWPAIWMLPTNWEYGGWPNSGEIDIMEHVGYEADSVYGSIHSESFNHIIGTQATKGLFCKTLNTDFHLYGIEWDENKIQFFFDNKPYLLFKNDRKGYKSWPFDKSFYLILNIAVGGNWGGKMGIDENIWPQRMEIDYVRVYKKIN